MDRETACFPWHAILPLRTESNFLDQCPLVWSIRKTSQLGGSKIQSRHFYCLVRLHYCRPSWHSIHSFRINPVTFLTTCCWPSTDEKQTWRSADPASGYPRHSYLPEYAMCAWLKCLSRTVVSIQGLLILELPKFQLVFMMWIQKITSESACLWWYFSRILLNLE